MNELIKLFDLKGVSYMEYISDIYVELTKNNEIVKGFLNELKDMYSKYPKVEKLLDDEEVDGLNQEECKAFIEISAIKREIDIINEREIFFAGGKEAYTYFKNIGIIK